LLSLSLSFIFIFTTDTIHNSQFTQFNDLTAITAAISITPTTCLLPVIMWNKKHGSTAPKWRLYLHYLFLFLSVLTAVVALVGAVVEIILKAS
jgi:hypothetical protein